MSSPLKENIPPYHPRWLSRFFEISASLPIPGWLQGVLFVVIFSGIHHLVAWNQGVLPRGEFDRYLIILYVYVPVILGAWRFLERVAVGCISEFSRLTHRTSEQRSKLVAEFLSMPELTAAMLLLSGIALGTFQYSSIDAVLPPAGKTLPLLNDACWGITSALALLETYRLIKQIKILLRLLDELEIDLFRPSPIYELSSYTATFAITALVVIYGPTLIGLPTFLFTPQGFIFILSQSLLAVLIFGLPLMRINSRMRREKKYLLDEIGARQRQLHERLMKSAGSRNLRDLPGLQAAVSALSQQRAELRKLSTWPWQPIAFLSVASTALLPVLIYLAQIALKNSLGL